MTLLADYEFQVADVLHDPLHRKWSLSQLDPYINEARRQLVMDTGCLRTLQPTYCTQGTEQYIFGQVSGAAILTGGSGYTAPSVSFSGGGGSGVAAALTQSGGAVNTITFTSFGSGYSSAPTPVISDPTGTGATLGVGIINVNTYDFLQVALIWGNERYTLDWRAWRDFSTWYRPFIASSYQRQPVCWAVYGDNSIFLGPTPDQNYAMEYDTIILPTPLTDYVTVDPIPSLSQDPIKWYAAYLAKMNAQSWGEAETLNQQYRRKLLEITSVYTGRIPNAYE